MTKRFAVSNIQECVSQLREAGTVDGPRSDATLFLTGGDSINVAGIVGRGPIPLGSEGDLAYEFERRRPYPSGAGYVTVPAVGIAGMVDRYYPIARGPNARMLYVTAGGGVGLFAGIVAFGETVVDEQGQAFYPSLATEDYFLIAGTTLAGAVAGYLLPKVYRRVDHCMVE